MYALHVNFSERQLKKAISFGCVINSSWKVNKYLLYVLYLALRTWMEQVTSLGMPSGRALSVQYCRDPLCLANTWHITDAIGWKKRRKINIDVVWANCTEHDLIPKPFTVSLIFFTLPSDSSNFQLPAVLFLIQCSTQKQTPPKKGVFSLYSLLLTPLTSQIKLNFVNFISYNISPICFCSFSISLGL